MSNKIIGSSHKADLSCYMKNKVKGVRSCLYDIYYSNIWEKSCRVQSFYGLNREARPIKIVVSLTSFPGRIHIVHKTIQTILNQERIKPDKVILWLANEQFANYYIPPKLQHLCKYGLEICWCQDIKSYKKLIPTLERYRDHIIVTADDDVYYERQWLEKLYNAYNDNPTYIWCHKATKFSYKNGIFTAVDGGKDYYKKASYLNKLVGVGGVLYPPNSLHSEVTNKMKFMILAPTNDDIWFWMMGIKNGTKVAVVNQNIPKPVDIKGVINTVKLTDINDKGEELFWQQFNKLCKVYPEVKQKLIDENQKLGVMYEIKSKKCY